MQYATLFTAVSALFVATVSARPSEFSVAQTAKSAICFDAGDCIPYMMTAGGWASCDKTGDNGYLFGLLGSCMSDADYKKAGKTKPA